jgi:hypothetical protein
MKAFNHQTSGSEENERERNLGNNENFLALPAREALSLPSALAQRLAQIHPRAEECGANAKQKAG